MQKIADKSAVDNPEPPVAPASTTAERFTALCWARARLWQICDPPELAPHVDHLQAWAVRNGLVREIGQDAVQAIMSAAFAAVRDDLGPAELPERVPDPLPEPDESSRPAQSTLDAAEYLARCQDKKRLDAFLKGRSDAEQTAIINHLVKKAQRHG